jgi:hypothetical protein
VTGFVIVERAWSVKRGGWRSLLLAALVVPEVIYEAFLHGVYVKALTDLATHERETWDHTKREEVTGRRSWRHNWKRIAASVYATLLLASVIGLALICAALSIAWLVIAGLVLAGAALAALLLSGLDPFGPMQGTGEPATLHHSVRELNHHGFGGNDVPAAGAKSNIHSQTGAGFPAADEEIRAVSACPVCIAQSGVTLEAQLSRGRLGRGTAEDSRENRLERRLVWRPRSVRWWRHRDRARRLPSLWRGRD